MKARHATLVALAAVVALVAPGCGSGQKQVDDNLSSALQRELDIVRTELHIPGVAAAVIYADGATWVGASGYRIKPATKATPETLFAVGSVTKTFTAAVVLRLVEEGVLGLDDPVGRWLAAYRGQPRLTIRRLLNHTSGISSMTDNSRFSAAVARNPRARWNSDRTLGFVGVPYFSPGKGWRYSNTNYILLGEIIERATHQTVGEELRRLILEPLGLDDIDLQDGGPPKGELSHGYEDITNDGKIEDMSQGTRFLPYTALATAAWTAGGIVASPRSVARFAQALFEGKLLSPASLAEMTRFRTYGDDVYWTDYGLGALRDASRGRNTLVGNHVVWGHNGIIDGYRALMWYAPRERVALAVLSNSNLQPEFLAERLLTIALEPTKQRPSVSDSLVRIDAMTGERKATVAVPASERLVASDGDVVWAYSETGATKTGTLTRVDPTTEAVTGSFDTSVPFATHLAAVGGNVWLGRPAWNPLHTPRPLVWRLRPSGGAVEPAKFAVKSYEFLAPVAAARSLWVSCCRLPPMLLRVDPATGRVLARIRGAEEVLAEGAGFVWASFYAPDRPGRHPPCLRPCLRRIDTKTNASTPIAAPGFVPADFALARGAVWASAPEEDALVRLDAATGKEISRVRIGESPGALVSANGALWVTLSGGSSVARYDVETGEIETIDVGGTPIDLTVAGDSVWVAVDT